MKLTMKQHLAAMCLVLTALVVLTGCGGPVKYPNYYTLHLPPPPDPPVAENVHATLAVREISIARSTFGKEPLFTKPPRNRLAFTTTTAGRWIRVSS